MQRDLDRYYRRRRFLHRLLAVVAITLVAGLAVAYMRACTEGFDEPYEKGYQPKDFERQQRLEGG